MESFNSETRRAIDFWDARGRCLTAIRLAKALFLSGNVDVGKLMGLTRASSDLVLEATSTQDFRRIQEMLAEDLELLVHGSDGDIEPTELNGL